MGLQEEDTGGGSVRKRTVAGPFTPSVATHPDANARWLETGIGIPSLSASHPLPKSTLRERHTQRHWPSAISFTTQWRFRVSGRASSPEGRLGVLLAEAGEGEPCGGIFLRPVEHQLA
jgi:hypothetical protein